jgi:UPF0271 protein
MMRDLVLFEAIVSAIAAYDVSLPLVILSVPDTSGYDAIAQTYGIPLLYELFADRAYRSDGSLVPRSEEGAVIESEAAVLARTEHLLNEGIIRSREGKALHLKADTLCVHGDTPTARSLVIALRRLLDAHRAGQL